ncbi:jg4621 [Pararge aegeria aegeria]|uniref:tRNA-specific adenosine deaminase 1 n=1 Tax=Pararge aegeria aegeria TaxID=348720 RepID=A0A8S4RQA0_9NEOP|nr:jg4621 [Pararge aegeria aegeria]
MKLYKTVSTHIENYQKLVLDQNVLEPKICHLKMPCGDASIIPKSGDSSDIGDLISKLGKREAQDDLCDVSTKKMKPDIHRTGAKCLLNNQQDPRDAGLNYHLVGQVRTKPGRGDRTLSVSCSDKISRWIHCGIQGSLLDMLLNMPVFIKHFIFGSGVPYSEEILNRALLKRESEINIEDRLKEIPDFYRSSLIFQHIRTDINERPAAGSIVCIKTKNRLLEVVVQGKKLGVTKKRAKDLSSSVSISKYSLYKKFMEVLQKNKELMAHICGTESIETIPYNEMKRKAIQYQIQWNRTKEVFFKSWTLKPDIWNFCVDKVT